MSLASGHPAAQRPTVVAVVGPHQCDERIHRIAHDVGRLLARAGAVVVTGGEDGVMAAASQGAHEAGGVTVGLLPGRDLVGANPYLSVPLPTGLGEARNALVVTSAHGVIAVGGSWGTESEIALAVRLGRPVVSVDGWVRHDAEGHPLGAVLAVASASEAVDAMMRR